jgi:PKD repeat protein
MVRDGLIFEFKLVKQKVLASERRKLQTTTAWKNIAAQHRTTTQHSRRSNETHQAIPIRVHFAANPIQSNPIIKARDVMKNWKRYLVSVALLGTLAACGQPNPETKPTNQTPTFLGTAGLNIGDAMPSDQLLPITKGAINESTVQITRLVSSGATDSSTERYVWSTYEVKNITAAPMTNLSFYTYNQASSNIGGTALQSVRRLDNTAITDIDIARGIRPSVGLTFANNAFSINPLEADFQAFRASEALNVETGAKTLGSLLTNDTILDYGFTVRSASGDRTLDPNELGTVTLGWRLPLQSVVADTPRRWRAIFTLATDTVTRVTRDLFETTAATIARAGAPINATEIALIGSDTDTAGTGRTTVRLPNVRWYITTQANFDLALETPINTVGSSVNFDATSSGENGVTYQWNFGDNTTSTSGIVSHAYTNPGLYNVKLVVTDNTGRTHQQTIQVAILPEIQNISPNLSLKGSDTASFDAGDPLPGFDYQWSFGDATTGTGSRINHSYPTLGTYVVKLKIIDNRPLTRSKTNRISGGGSTAYQNETWITRWEPKPKAKFSLSSSLGTGASFGLAPYLVNFDASASSGSTALTYAWSFGDTTTGTGMTTSHTFAPGENIVKLTVTDAKGQTDTYRAYVTAKLSEAATQVQNPFFRPVFTYPSATRAKVIDPLDSLPGTKSTPLSYAQAKSSTRAGTNYIDYFPYVMHKSATITRIPTRWNAWSNGSNYRPVVCSEIKAYYNAVQILQPFISQNAVNSSLCDFMQIRPIDIPVLKAQGNSEVFVTSSLFDQTYRFDVFGGLRIPHVYIAVVPDKMIPGEIASPWVTENIGNFNGTKELMLTVRVRQSELLNSNLKFKVPVYAVDDSGALMTTANGYFKAAFKIANTAVTTDCGECVMENGKAYIEVTMPNTAYALASAGLDLSQVSLYGNPNCGTDNSDWVTKMPDSALLNNCNTVTATYVPPTGIAGIPDFKYPIPTETTMFRDHILTGGLATDVNKWRSYVQDGIWDDAKNFVNDFIPFLGSGKNFLAAVKACQVQTCSVLGYGAIVLAGVAVVADVVPATGVIYAKFAKVFKPSRLTTKGVSNGLEQVIKEGVDATKTVDGLGTALETAFGKVVTGIGECGPDCADRVEAAFKVYTDEQLLDAKTVLGKVNTDFQNPKYTALNLSSFERIEDIEASVYCIARGFVSGVSASLGTERARAVKKNLCPTSVTKVGDLVTRVTATLDPLKINGGTTPSGAAKREVAAAGAGLDDSGHILAYVLGGAGGLRSDNIVPMLFSLNRGKISQLEQYLARKLPTTSIVLTVDLEYLDAAYPKRPSTITYSWTENGVAQTPKSFPNPHS